MNDLTNERLIEILNAVIDAIETGSPESIYHEIHKIEAEIMAKKWIASGRETG